jgi:hypothetical protein
VPLSTTIRIGIWGNGRDGAIARRSIDQSKTMVNIAAPPYPAAILNMATATGKLSARIGISVR